MSNENKRAAPSVTVDTPEFRKITWAIRQADGGAAHLEAIRDLIAHFDAHAAAVAAKAVEEATKDMVPLSADRRSVFIDGFGLLDIAYPSAPQQHAQAADDDRQTEAHKLAKILFGMVEGDGRVEGADIYADGYSAPDGDVYVIRAAELLIEQAAESKELTRYVEHFDLKAKATEHAQAALREVREAVLTYYDALTARQHGGVAQDKAFNAIQQALGLSWQFGVDHRAAHPQQPAAAPEPCTAPAQCDKQGCANPLGRCEEVAPAVQVQDELAAFEIAMKNQFNDVNLTRCDCAPVCWQDSTTMKYWEIWQARAALSAQARVEVVPEGWALVPKEATQQMVNDGMDEDSGTLRGAYRAMLAAAPVAPSPAQAQPVADVLAFQFDVLGNKVNQTPADAAPVEAQPVGYVEDNSLNWLVEQPHGRAPGIMLYRHKGDVVDPVAVYAAQPPTAQGDAKPTAPAREPWITGTGVPAYPSSTGQDIMLMPQVESFAKGRAAGIEEAAKLIETSLPNWDGIYKAIRALAAKPAEGV